ncbi:MAG: hypothetical protein HY735_27475 [Verrucomicrobia bacterium]|nr:hypothetical protein [Verrucomicrobiota bacterium]
MKSRGWDAALVFVGTILPSLAAAVSAGELADARRWAAARFEGVQPVEKVEPGQALKER